jgi:hypothetical protein
VLSVADLEANVFEFRQRAFQYARLASIGGAEYAVFVRTETESESRFRPKLVHLLVAVPHPWVVVDPASDTLRVAKDGRTPTPALTEPVVEVGAEPTEFSEQGVAWRRAAAPSGALVYVPADVAAGLLTPAGLAALSG